MEYEQILQELKEWTNDECLFRDFAVVKQNKISLDSFLETYQYDVSGINMVMHPEKIASFRSEDEFISTGRNVSIVKHPRYFPLFYHEHGFFEMIYVISGNCIQHFQEKKIILSKGDLCLLAPGVMHGIEVYNDSIILNILIRYTTFLDIFINTVRDKTQISHFFLDNIYSRKKVRYLMFQTQGDAVIRNYILDMYMEQRNPDEYSDRIICSLVTIFFTQLIRRHQSTLEIPKSHKDGCETSMINYIINEYKNVSIDQVADHFHYSRQYCSKLIKEVTGYTFSELLTNIRMQQSENLLVFTSMSIADISDKVGYKNPETFIRMFKKHMRDTPSHYRKQNSQTGIKKRVPK